VHINVVGSVRSPALCSSAERTLLDTIRLVFTGSINYSAESSDEFESATKILSHFVDILDKHSSDSANSQKAAASSRRAVSRTNPPLDNTSLDSETTELLLALRAVNVMMLASRSTISTSHSILRSPMIVALIRDDVSRCIVMLSSRRDFVPMILQSILSLFGTLFTLYGPFLRVMISCFVPSVYLKALHQLSNHFAKQYDTILRPMASDYDPYDRPSTPALPPATPGQVTPTGINFNFDEMEMILESLGDLISDPGFVPTLFASFDCDPSSPNIVQQLIRYLCQCSRYAVVMEGQRVGQNSMQLYEHCIHILRHVLKTLFIRCNNSVVGTSHVNSGRSSTSTPVQAEEECSSENGVPSRVKIECRAEDTLENLSKSLRSLRASKSLLSEAAKRFVIKPQKGLQYLQEQGALPKPLTPQSVAKFLRIAKDLPKEVVGSFLGELGKDDANFEADAKEFHAQVLLFYVQSFSLEDQSVLNCMRIFLSAFRLPGEAQQIDRILVAFSEFCHSKCLEGRSGLLENAEVTYLLTFSIIMLNTDRHNPNIKVERKMTMEQFVRNNANYGADVKQTYPLPPDFLESIYASISECPIRTESNDVLNDVTLEVWMDLQLQASNNISRSSILSCCHPSEHINALATYLVVPLSPKPHSAGSIDAIHFSNKSTIEAYSSCSAHEAAFILLTAEKDFNSLELSTLIDGAYSFVDADLASCIWQDLLAVAICPYLVDKNNQRHATAHNGSSVYADEELGSISGYVGVGAGSLGLQLSVDICVVVSKISDFLQLNYVVDAITLMLAEFAGLITVSTLC
jgi:Sec7-like guanine-nucleotide exchange factor